MPDVRDRELVHQDFAAGFKDSFPNQIDVVDSEGALKPQGRIVVKELAALLNRTHGLGPGLVQDLKESWGTVFAKLPSEHRPIERLRGIDVFGVDRKVGDPGGHAYEASDRSTGGPSTLRPIMSNSRQHRSRVRGTAITHPPGLVGLPTQPGWDYLVFAHAGLFTAMTDDRAWTVPAHRVLCVPSGTQVRIETARRVAVRCLYVRSDLGMLDAEVRVASLAPLTRELLMHAVVMAPMRLETAEENALMTLLAERLANEPTAQLHLPLPSDRVARDLALRVMKEPAVDLAQHLEAANAGRRTLERRFKSETQMSLGQWRRRARVLAAVGMLGQRESVTSVAMAVGYSSPSSFVSAFRAELGLPPREFMRR